MEVWGGTGSGKGWAGLMGMYNERRVKNDFQPTGNEFTHFGGKKVISGPVDVA